MTTGTAPTFDPDRIEAVCFDSYGTLMDTGSAARVLEGLVDDPDAAAQEWRENALFYSVVAGDLEQYGTYFDLHLDGLRDALRDRGVEPSEERLRELNAVYHDLEPFDGVAETFAQLADAGYRPSILSNGNPKMLDSLVAATGVGAHVEAVVSADEIRTMKPNRAIYELAADRLDLAPDRLVHVTAHWMDVQGAMHAGMAGAFLNRGDGQWPSFGPEPSLTVGSLEEVLECLGVEDSAARD